MNKRKILNDPVYGFITIPSDLIFDLIEHRLFQRLRRIKQLGLTHYVYPGALHTRFQHAIGAMHLTGLAIQSLRTKGVHISDEEGEATRIAILLHDLGHGPYSHALEHLLLPWSHEDITRALMQSLRGEFGADLDLAIRIFEGSYDRKFLNQLVTSQLDMDRLDYLKRDSFFTGVAEGVIGHDRIITMLNVSDDRIVVEEKALFSIEKFLVARRIMYLQVYLHKAVISAEQMVRQAVTFMRMTHPGAGTGISPALSHLFEMTPATPTQLSDDILDAFTALDDVDIDFSLKALSTGHDDLLKYLSQGLIRRKLFRTVFSEEPIPEGKIHETIGQVARTLNLGETQAARLVITGKETIPTYDPSQGDILMQMKSGEVIPLPQLLETPEHSEKHVRYYLCYPVKRFE